MRFLLTVLPWLVFTAACVDEPGGDETSIVDDIWAGDSVRVIELQVEGSRYEESDVVVWVPGGVDSAYARALTDTLNRGVMAVEELVRAPLDWAKLGEDPVIYYLSPDTFISHGTGEGAVFISWFRTQNGLAPYKPEAVHEILWVEPPFPDFEGDPTDEERYEAFGDWLFEGQASYLALLAEAEHGLHEGDVLNMGGLDEVDSNCKQRIVGEKGMEVLPYIPGRGGPPALMTTERRVVAPIFYTCSVSFVKYLAGEIDLDALVDLNRYFDPTSELERATQKSLEEWRSEWLMSIGYPSSESS